MYRNTDKQIMFLVILLYVLLVGFIAGLIIRTCKQEQPPVEPATYFSDDSRSAELFFLINNLREREELPVLNFELELAERAYKQAKEYSCYNSCYNSCFYYINDNAENAVETVFKVWTTSETYAEMILNEKTRKVGIATYYDEKTQNRVYVAIFN